MTVLETLAPDTPLDDIAAVLERDGAVIVGDVLSPADVDQLNAELQPYVDATAPGRDEATVLLTTRT